MRESFNELFNVLYARFYGMVHASAYLLLRDKSEVDDLCQDAWLLVWERLTQDGDDFFLEPASAVFRALSTCLPRYKTRIARAGGPKPRGGTRRQRPGVSLDLPVRDPDGRETTLRELIPAPPALTPEDRELSPAMSAFLDSLSAQEYTVLMLTAAGYRASEIVADGKAASETQVWQCLHRLRVRATEKLHDVPKCPQGSKLP